MTSEELQRELSNIRREIDELREHELEIEMALGSVRGSLRWLRAPYACLLKKSVETRIQSLRLRYNVVYNCYLTVRGDEERASGGAGRRGPTERAAGEVVVRDDRRACIE